MSYQHARNALIAGIAATLVVTVGPATADAAVHFGAGAPGTATDSHADFVPGESDIIDSFYDGRGLGILLRRGYWAKGKGYGWEKIIGKHGLANLAVIRGVIENPSGGAIDPDRPTRKNYKAYARQDECVVGVGCRPVHALEVKATWSSATRRITPRFLG